VNIWKDLEKRVSIGDKLDTTDEATLSKLTAARKRGKKHNSKSNQSKVNIRKDLEQRVSNAKTLDTADEATLSKLTAAYESNKKNSREHNRENYQSAVRKKWSADEDLKLAQLVGKCKSTRTNWSDIATNEGARRSNAAIATTIA
jgi:hypothetical protein